MTPNKISATAVKIARARISDAYMQWSALDRDVALAILDDLIAAYEGTPESGTPLQWVENA